MAETITQSELKAVYFYDPIVGVFIRKVDSYHSRHHRAGEISHTLENTGYIHLGFSRKGSRGPKRMLAHRAAWLYMHGSIPDGMDVDHKNGRPADNAISNLRLATRSQNIQNAKVRKDNTCGYKGVYFHKKSGKWSAQVHVAGKTHSFGYWDTAEQAHQRREEAAKELHGEFYYKNTRDV